MKNLFIITLAVTALVSPLSSNLAYAAGKCKPINKLPVQIDNSGVYCLNKNLTFSSAGVAITNGNAIVVAAENTVLDLNGFTLSGGTAPDNTQAIGIHVTADNVTIRNGRVINFRTGIYSGGLSSGIVVEDITAAFNKYIGIYLYAEKSVIRNNAVFSTGGSTYMPNSPAYGIFGYGDNINILNNTIIGVTSVGTGYAMGISTFLAFDGRNNASHNMISSIESPSGVDAGIWFQNGDNNIASDNRITNPGGIGIAYGGTGPYMNNLVTGATSTDYNGTGTAVGTTNY